MKCFKKGCSLTVLFLLTVFYIGVCSNELRAEKLPGKQDKRKLALVVGEGKDQIKIAFALVGATQIRTGGTIKLTNAITDFVLPFNKLNSTLVRSGVGGEEVVNEIEIVGNTKLSQTTLICRLTTKGTGGGQGNIGVSLLVAFSLDKSWLTTSGGLILKTPSRGKLTSARGTLKEVPEYVKKDLAKAGAKSKNYTDLLFVNDSSTSFNGFVVFDPTNPESINDAYFEFSSSESDNAWSLTEVK